MSHCQIKRSGRLGGCAPHAPRCYFTRHSCAGVCHPVPQHAFPLLSQNTFILHVLSFVLFSISRIFTIVIEIPHSHLVVHLHRLITHHIFASSTYTKPPPLLFRKQIRASVCHRATSHDFSMMSSLFVHQLHCLRMFRHLSCSPHFHFSDFSVVFQDVS